MCLFIVTNSFTHCLVQLRDGPIEDFDDLVDLRTLAFYCLGLEPSAFVLQNIEIEEKKSKC